MTNPTPDQVEKVAAEKVANLAVFLANHDKEKSVGIIWKAFDLLTADLSQQRKRALILGDKSE